MMGKGIDKAVALGLDPALATLLDDTKEQLLLTLVRRYPGGIVELPIAEINDTEGWFMLLSIDVGNKTMRFEARHK